MTTFNSFEEELNQHKCERCKLPFHPQDLLDIGVPGIAGYKVCRECWYRMPEKTRQRINSICAEWA